MARAVERVGHVKIFLQKQKNLLTSFFFFVNSLCNLGEAAYGHTRVVNAELCGLIRCERSWTNSPLFWSPNLTGWSSGMLAGEIWAFCLFGAGGML
jgi:hypothetical protein